MTATAPDVTGDAQRLMPAGNPQQSPWVVVVARQHTHGLQRAQEFLRQVKAGVCPSTVRLLGLVTVADAPARPPRDVLKYQKLVAGGYPRHFHVPWLPEWRQHHPDPEQGLPRDVAHLLGELHAAAAGPHITEGAQQ